MSTKNAEKPRQKSIHRHRTAKHASGFARCNWVCATQYTRLEQLPAGIAPPYNFVRSWHSAIPVATNLSPTISWPAPLLAYTPRLDLHKAQRLNHNLSSDIAHPEYNV